MRLRLAAVLAVVALALAVPTVAMTTGGAGDEGGDPVAGAVELSPHDGPNGRYATVEDGELRVDFKKLNDRATTTAHDVLDVASTADESIEVWIETDAASVVAYESDDPAATLDRETVRELQPGETLSVGFRVDTRDEMPEAGTVTVGARIPDEDGWADDEEVPTERPPPAEREDPGGEVSEIDDEVVVVDAAAGVEVRINLADDERDLESIDLDETTIETLDSLPPDGPRAPPRATIDRGSITSGLEYDGFSVHGERLVTEPERAVRITGSQSTVYGVPGVALEPRPLSIVSITPPEGLRDRPAVVRMTVDRDRFEETDPTAARIGRQTDGGWQILSTRVVETSDETVTLAATTAGFSAFTVFAESDVDYEWTLPDGMTVDGDELETSFDAPGYYDVTLTVTDAEGQSDSTIQRIVVNDDPDVVIEGATNVTEGRAATLRANVTNEIGNATITWTLPGGRTETGEAVTAIFESGDRVAVTVEDEFGATATDEVAVDVAPVPDERQPPGFQIQPLVGSWLQMLLAAIAVGIAAMIVRSAAVERGLGGVRKLSQTVDPRRSAAPKIVVFEPPRWSPERQCLEIETLEITTSSRGLQTVELTIADDGGESIVQKTIDVTECRYRASPERVPIYGDFDLSERDDYDITVRAADQDDNVVSKQIRADRVTPIAETLDDR